MTDPGDRDEDPGESEGEHATVDEVADELVRLGRLGWDRIELSAVILVRGTTMAPRDLVNTTVERLLTPTGQRRRRWHRQETISACFARTMRSIVWDWWRRRQIVNFVAMGGDDGDVTGVINRVSSP